MTEPLVVVAERRIMGEIRRDRRGRLTLAYDDRWRSADAAYPLSLSMPLVTRQHEHSRIEPWLWGLLPDDEVVLARWGRQFHVSSRNALALLSAVGEDCAGAIRLVRPDRVDAILREPDGRQQVEWLTEADIAERLRTLRKDPAAWRAARDTGQFSLAGAQPKTALFFDGRQWGVPFGETPTTHILKPPIDGFDGHAVNEHLCLALARRLGLPAARSEILEFEEETAVVIERYDRARSGRQIRRLHQEDLCQVLSLHPTRKHQNEGGPGCAEIANAIRTHSNAPETDALSFARAILFNWLIGGTDAHAKNYSMLIGAGGRSRLAPLYDVASALPYDLDPQRLKMAMKIGGKYRLDDVYGHHWSRFAQSLRFSSAELLETGISMAERLPGALEEAVNDAGPAADRHLIADRMLNALRPRAERCAGILDAAPA